MKLAAFRAVRPLLLALTLCAFPGLSVAGTSPQPNSSSSTSQSPASRRMQQNARKDRASVIVQWQGPLTPARRQMLSPLHVSFYRALPLIQADALRLPVSNLPRLKALGFVKHVSPDLNCRRSDEYTVGATGADVAFAEYGVTGAGVTIAVLDSGIQSERLDIQGRTVASVNFADDAQTTDDLCGHGTHVAGIIAGDGTASTGPAFFRTFYGIAPQAQLVNVRVLDSDGSGSVSDVVAGLGWVVANQSQYGIRIVNLSLGHSVGESYKTDPLCQAVEAAYKAGLVVVCAAGNAGRVSDTPQAGASNEGYGAAWGSIQSPGNDPDVITVGAMKSVDGIRADDQVATYSSRGPSRLDLVMKPDIVAPGNRIISVNANNSYLDAHYGLIDAVGLSEYSTLTTAPADTYLRLSGTSMAAPVVAGAAALLLEADPTLSPDTIKARLMISADKTGYGPSGLGSTNPNTYGAGYLDIPAALQSSYVATQAAASPTLLRTRRGFVYINTRSLTAGGAGFWGTGLYHPADIWGSQVIWGENSVSGSQVIWGEYILSSSQVIWGENVWTDQVIWGESTTDGDLSSTAVVGDPDALTQGPLSMMTPDMAVSPANQ